MTDRFTKTCDTIIDRKTGLEWQRKDLPRAPWQQQMDRAEALGDGWRLPTRAELIAAYDDGELRAALKMGENCWSSSTYDKITDYAWYVIFYGGFDNYNFKKMSYPARAVRDAATEIKTLRSLVARVVGGVDRDGEFCLDETGLLYRDCCKALGMDDG